MSNTDTVKKEVKKHSMISFTAGDLECERGRVKLLGRYGVPQDDELFKQLGLRENLTHEIFAKPVENWPLIQNALSTIKSTTRFGAVVNDSTVVTFLKNPPKEDHQLDFDKRIDSLMNSLDEANQDLVSINFHPEDGVLINTTNRNQIDCGMGDLWKFGTETTIGYVGQQFNNYFLRLICTNGMTTKENMAYRQISAGEDVSKQFINYTKDEQFQQRIKPRVDALRNNRASFYEVDSIAQNLKKEEIKTFMPWYLDEVETYKNRGHYIEHFSAKRKKLVYTNQNLYDVFNLGTYLASHEAEELGRDKALGLNKASAHIFTNGPNLTMTFLDAYKN